MLTDLLTVAGCIGVQHSRDSFLRWEVKDYGDVLMAVGADRCSLA
jgi:hypothetical protein